MKNWTLFFCMIMLISSCNSLIKSKPSSIISEEKMTDILVDLHLTEAIVRIGNDSVGHTEDSTQLRIRFAEVFKKYDTKPDQFTFSLNYYLEHIDELDKIYADVIVRLTEMDAKLTPKVSDTSNVAINRSKSELDSISNNNPWFRALKKNSKTTEFQYFDTSNYQAESQPGQLIKP